MKSLRLLQQLAKNPFYTLTPEEEDYLNNPPEPGTENQGLPKKRLVSPRGNAAVKSVGKINKHNTDPVAE